MTIELGNINKGIPMGSYTPGEGGGGAAKVTGVDPIAVTNGSVAIKIDEQTLQVNEQGELSANLDELGNEVNDLSGRVTAVEADVLEKQDTFIPEKPLVLGKQVIKNYKGMTIADNKVSSTGGQSFTATNISTFTINAGNVAPPVSYIEIPYKSGQVIQVPTNKWDDTNGKLGLFFGSWQDDGNFLVTAAFTPEDSYKNSDGCFGGLFSDGPIAMPSTETTPALKTYSNVGEKADSYISIVPDKNSYFQILMSDTLWAIQLYASGLSNNTVQAKTWVISNNNIGTTKFDVITPKTTTCLIMMNNSSLKVPTNSIGLYDWGSRLQWTQEGYQNFLANKGHNLFSFEQQGEHDSLSLNIGSGLSVVDGKLVANLDELGNEVNSLTGEVTDLSGRVSAVEADVLKKENKITPIAPLGLREYIKSTLKGFTYTTDGQSIYQNAIEGSAGIASDYSSLYAIPNRSESTINNLFLSYIDIPFTFGKVYTIGQKKSSSSYHAEGSFVLGKTLADGTFIPILWEYSDVRITTSDTYRVVNQHITFDTISGGSLSFNNGASQEAGISSGWLQLIKTDTGVLYNRSRPSSNYASDHLQLNITNTTAIARLDECDTLRLVPSATDWYAWGGSAASAVPVSQIGMYSYSGTAAGNITWEQLGTNEFQIGAAISHNYLELSLGSGLSVVDGKLTSTGSASMPSDRYIDLTLGDSGAIYTAPANGWFTVAKIAGATNKYLQIGTEMLTDVVFPSSPGDWAVVYLPVKKGDRVSPIYNVIGPTQYFRFIYAEGEI